MKDPLCRLIVLLWFMGASTSAAAAVVVLPLTDLPWVQIVVGMGISMWGGLANIAVRATAAIRRAQKQAEDGLPVTPPPRLMPAALLDVFVSGTLGVAAYAVGAWQTMDMLLSLLVLLAAGFGGARLAEPLGDITVEGAQRWLRGLLGVAK